ncbi:MAG: hypothetical protein AAB758_02950, partial [Patescibacteria group bacterium]
MNHVHAHTEMFEDSKKTIKFFWGELWKPLVLLVVMTALATGSFWFMSSLGSMSWDNTRFIRVVPIGGLWMIGGLYTLILLSIYASFHDDL